MNRLKEHFTAWLTTDPKLGLSEFAEIDVLEDDLIGEDPEDDGNWTTKPGVNPSLSVATDVAKATGSDKSMQDAALDALSDNGWRLAGPWEQTDHGHIAVVERES